jgi:hypothetical protein
MFSNFQIYLDESSPPTPEDKQSPRSAENVNSLNNNEKESPASAKEQQVIVDTNDIVFP